MATTIRVFQNDAEMDEEEYWTSVRVFAFIKGARPLRLACLCLSRSLHSLVSQNDSQEPPNPPRCSPTSILDFPGQTTKPTITDDGTKSIASVACSIDYSEYAASSKDFEDATLNSYASSPPPTSTTNNQRGNSLIEPTTTIMRHNNRVQQPQHQRSVEFKPNTEIRYFCRSPEEAALMKQCADERKLLKERRKTLRRESKCPTIEGQRKKNILLEVVEDIAGLFYWENDSNNIDDANRPALARANTLDEETKRMEEQQQEQDDSSPYHWGASFLQCAGPSSSSSATTES